MTGAQHLARRMVAAGEAGALYLAGLLAGCGLLAAADLIARSIG